MSEPHIDRQAIPLSTYRQQLADAGHCMSNRDGECYWEGCPQLRDGEPAKTGRPCPRDLDTCEEQRK